MAGSRLEQSRHREPHPTLTSSARCVMPGSMSRSAARVRPHTTSITSEELGVGKKGDTPGGTEKRQSGFDLRRVG